MKTKKQLVSLGFALTAAIAATNIAKADTATTQPLQPLPNSNNTTQTPTANEQGWLGIGLAPVPAVLSNQLGNLIPKNQGVMVQSVSQNSPAAKAGLQPYDVILTLDDQKLYSPNQLAQLVKSKPASTVKLKVVHQGQIKDFNITLGKRNVPQYRTGYPMNMSPGWPRMYRPVPMVPLQPMPPMTPPSQQGKNTLAWDSFQSVQVKTLPDGRYHAEVSFKDANGEIKNFTFEGKQDEITEQINKQTDLPADKKQALLNALNMQPGQLFKQPFFSQPFGNSFFNDPFFRQGFPAFPDLNRLFAPIPAPSMPPSGHGTVL